MESAEQKKALMKASCWNTSRNPKMHKQKLHIGVEKYNFKKDRKQVYVDDNFVFPSGYRFCPHDQELIVYYLRKKILNEVLPHNKIKEVNLYKHTPQELSENYEVLGDNEWYFFTPRDRKYPNGDRPNRAAGTGYWKATGADRDIMQEEVKIGSRKALVFYHGKPPKGDKTNWIMHEYRVDESRQLKAHAFDMKLDDWVLCRIYKRESKSKNTTRKQEDVSKNNSPLPVMVVDKLENEEIMDNSCVEFAKQQFGPDDPNFTFDFSNYNPDYFPHYGAGINIPSPFSPPATFLSDPRELYQESNISPPATFLFSPPATLLSNPGELYEVSNVSPPATLLSNPNVSPPATLLSNPRELYDISNISPPATLLSNPRELYEISNISPPSTLLLNPRELYEVVSNISPPATFCFSPPATLLSNPRELYEVSNIFPANSLSDPRELCEVSNISPPTTSLSNPRELYEESNICLPATSLSDPCCLPATSLSDPREMYKVSNISPPATSLSDPSELCEESNVSPPPATSPSDSSE